MGFIERVRRTDVPALEARARAAGQAGYRVFDRHDARDDAAPPGDEVFALRFVEPLERNRTALGVNTLSVPQARAAIESAVRTDRPAASAGFVLTQDLAGEQHVGVVLYQAIYRGQPTTAAERVEAVCAWLNHGA